MLRLLFAMRLFQNCEKHPVFSVFESLGNWKFKWSLHTCEEGAGETGKQAAEVPHSHPSPNCSTMFTDIASISLALNFITILLFGDLLFDAKSTWTREPVFRLTRRIESRIPDSCSIVHSGRLFGAERLYSQCPKFRHCSGKVTMGSSSLCLFV